jgi:hypothetical protein
MRKSPLTLVVFMFILNSCGQKFYTKQDYSFFDKNFVLNADAALKTEGVYVLESIWSDENGGVFKSTESAKFYKFYKSGQSNLTLFDKNIKSDQDFLKLIENGVLDSEKNKKSLGTLFQGYYKLQNSRIVIQSVNASLRQFSYSYGFVENDKLIIVKKTTEGGGSFDDQYFTNYYKETYLFKPLNNINPDVVPNW